MPHAQCPHRRHDALPPDSQSGDLNVLYSLAGENRASAAPRMPYYNQNGEPVSAPPKSKFSTEGDQQWPWVKPRDAVMSAIEGAGASVMGLPNPTGRLAAAADFIDDASDLYMQPWLHGSGGPNVADDEASSPDQTRAAMRSPLPQWLIDQRGR
jgi:hypothetical protein